MPNRLVRLLSPLFVIMLALLVVLPATAAPKTSPAQDAVARAVTWIKTQQQPDGSFAGFGAGSTADAMLALATAGENPAALATAGHTPVAYFTGQAAEIAKDTGLAAKIAIALLVSGQSPRSSIGVDLVAAVKNGYDAGSGHYGADVTSQALAMLALRAAGEQVPELAITWLTTVQLDDGSWSFTGDRTPGGGDTNTTALAIQALVANGQKDSQAVQKAIAYLRTQQNPDGGFPYSQTSPYGNESDANSTAYVIQALIAVGEDPASWTRDGATPLSRLLAFQNESGAFRYQDSWPDDNQLATYQAVPALLGVTFPLEPLLIIQQPQPAPTQALPLPGTGVAEQPATLPNTGAAEQVSLPIAAVAVLLVLAGMALRARRSIARS